MAYSELQQGLSTACSPEIDIVQTATTVRDLLNAMAFVVQESRLVEKVRELVVDSTQVDSIASGIPHTQLSKISQMQKANATAMTYIREQMPVLYGTFRGAVQRLANCAENKEMIEVDALVYGLRFVTQSLIAALRTELAKQTIAHNESLRTQIERVRRTLNHDVILTCTRVMSRHTKLYHSISNKLSGSEILKKYVAAYLLRRRVKLLAKIHAWNLAAGGRQPLVKFQARLRGFLQRRRMKRFREDSAALAAVDARRAGEEAEEEELDVSDVTIGYFDWPRVLIQYLQNRPEIRDIRDATMQLLKLLRDKRMSEDGDAADVETGEVFGDQDQGAAMSSETRPYNSTGLQKANRFSLVLSPICVVVCMCEDYITDYGPGDVDEQPLETLQMVKRFQWYCSMKTLSSPSFLS